MSGLLDRLRRRAAATSLPQAARQIEQAARADGSSHVGIGGDTPPGDEPLRFVASDRMLLPAGDLAEVEAGEAGQMRVTANVLGLAGATPALPPYYSEIQLQRRRLRDRSFAGFLNLFDHRTLSFFYRIFRKYNWLLSFERDAGKVDPLGDVLLAFAGLPTPAMRARLPVEDGALVPLAAQLGDIRRSAAALETILRHVTGLPLRVVEAEPTWMAVPAEEQTRLGAPGFARFARLGGGEDGPDAAMIGAAVLDVQHHFAVEIGPLSYAALLDFCGDGRQLRIVRELCHLAAGIEHRPVVRLRIARREVPPMRLGAPATPAFLGRTSWLGSLGPSDEIVADCTIPIGVATASPGLAA
ncbi:type VI secretion system baseplate subunit TssG [Sphingomonas profundi]|uniref:type VI secretion system baseplate subunit TssG n=1 Tax=Alterirhizorhabdus profundi TaxID=2681549 RepID=UPI0018D1B89F|nr:type VI secretion system baseplate subunit TssG [Sphingomonas profundi]